MDKTALLDKLKTWPQYLLPHHLLTRGVYYLTRMEGGKVTQFVVKKFVDLYQVDMSSAVEPDPEAYPSFNAFFTRELTPEARPLAADGVLSPVDGEISQIGKVSDGRIFQAKGHDFSLLELLGGQENIAKYFKDACFCTIYLSPRDYHRIHMPVAGQPLDMAHVPGRLFSVNQSTTRTLPKLFARNERVISLFRSEAGAMCMVMVGALFVGSMETVWDGQITPPGAKKVESWHATDTAGKLARGAEMGRFNMGSTVILLFDAKRVNWLDSMQPGTKVRMGEKIAELVKKAK